MSRTATGSVRRPTTALAGVLLLSAAAACGGGGGAEQGSIERSDPASLGPQGEPVAGGDLTYCLTADANGFSPVNDSWSSVTYTMVGSILEPLAAVAEDGTVAPYLAASIEPNDDATVWTITPRQGVQFTNGQALTAEVIAKNLQAQRESPVNGTILALVASVQAVDGAVAVTMSEPWVAFPSYLTGPIGRPLSPAQLADPDAASVAPVGTGPFVLDSYAPDNRLVMVRNPDYWRDGLPYLDEVEFAILPDSQTREQTLDVGDCDAMTTTSADHIVKYSASQEYDVYRPAGPSQSEFTFMLNTVVPPLDDVRVRRALGFATDRELLIETVGRGLSEPATGPWTRDSQWYCETDYPTYDLEAAKALVREYEAENGPVEISLMSVPVAESLQSAELAQSLWGEAGIDVKIEQAELSSLINRALTGDFNSVIWQEYGSVEPDGEYYKFHSDFAEPVGTVSRNPARIADPELDAGFETGRASLGQQERAAGYCAVQERLSELMPSVWVGHSSTAGVIASSTIGGIAGTELPDGQIALPPNGSPVPSHSLVQTWRQAS